MPSFAGRQVGLVTPLLPRYHWRRHEEEYYAIMTNIFDYAVRCRRRLHADTVAGADVTERLMLYAGLPRRYRSAAVTVAVIRFGLRGHAVTRQAF